MRRDTREMVLALRPFARGLAYALFEAPSSPIDWGIKEIIGAGRETRMLKAAKLLIERMQPDALVLEERRPRNARSRGAAARLRRQLANFAHGHSIDVHCYARREVQECFAGVGAKTRMEIARAIASRIDAFEHLLPEQRTAWGREPNRLNLFDAASLVMTYFCRFNFYQLDPG